MRMNLAWNIGWSGVCASYVVALEAQLEMHRHRAILPVLVAKSCRESAQLMLAKLWYV